MSDLLKSRKLPFLPSSDGGARGQFLNVEGYFNTIGPNNQAKEYVTQKLKVDVQNIFNVKFTFKLEYLLVFKNSVLYQNLGTFCERQ